MDNFERSIAFVLKWEGGYSNHPDDPGGETKHGISKRAYPHLDIKNLTEEKAKEIYREDYWEKSGCPSLDWPMCLVHLDTAVNMGVAGAIRLKSRAFNWTDYLFLRIEHYLKLKKPMFLSGWVNRVLDLWRTAKGEEHPISGGM